MKFLFVLVAALALSCAAPTDYDDAAVAKLEEEQKSLDAKLLADDEARRAAEDTAIAAENARILAEDTARNAVIDVTHIEHDAHHLARDEARVLLDLASVQAENERVFAEDYARRVHVDGRVLAGDLQLRAQDDARNYADHVAKVNEQLAWRHANVLEQGHLGLGYAPGIDARIGLHAPGIATGFPVGAVGAVGGFDLRHTGAFAPHHAIAADHALLGQTAFAHQPTVIAQQTFAPQPTLLSEPAYATQTFLPHAGISTLAHRGLGFADHGILPQAVLPHRSLDILPAQAVHVPEPIVAHALSLPQPIHTIPQAIHALPTGGFPYAADHFGVGARFLPC